MLGAAVGCPRRRWNAGRVDKADEFKNAYQRCVVARRIADSFQQGFPTFGGTPTVRIFSSSGRILPVTMLYSKSPIVIPRMNLRRNQTARRAASPLKSAHKDRAILLLKKQLRIVMRYRNAVRSSLHTVSRKAHFPAFGRHSGKARASSTPHLVWIRFL